RARDGGDAAGLQGAAVRHPAAIDAVFGEGPPFDLQGSAREDGAPTGLEAGHLVAGEDAVTHHELVGGADRAADAVGAAVPHLVVGEGAFLDDERTARVNGPARTGAEDPVALEACVANVAGAR